MKKYFFISSIIILFVSFSIFIFLNIKIDKNINKNKQVLNTFNMIFSKQSLDISFENNLPKLQINRTDYIGIINISKNKLSLPIENKCNNSFINIQSACNYSNKSFIILVTNLKDSFSSYKLYDVGNTITFTNMLGNIFQYKIKSIERINNLNNVNNYNEDLIIIIKNYYDMKYILFICDFY